MKHLLIILSILLLSSPLFGQSERPETIIIPVSGIGQIPDSRKIILQNKLTNKLKQYFRIVPQEKYEQVLEQVFEELEYEECSEDTCIMRVQEMLQVENVFHLQLIGEGNDIQLNLKWTTLEEKRNEEYFCEKCSTKDLYYKLEGLVDKLVGERDVVKEEPPKKVEPIVVVEKSRKGVLYQEYGKWGWIEDGDEKKDGKYEGEIKNGKPNGKGTSTYPGGGKYVGEFKDGKKNGKGTETYPNGGNYVGEFKDNLQSQGTYTFPDGGKYVGEFKDGKQWNGTQYDKGGKILGKYMNGKRIEQ